LIVFPAPSFDHEFAGVLKAELGNAEGGVGVSASWHPASDALTASSDANFDLL
jgi:hypothetical protein